MVTICLTFIATTLLYAALLFFACRRVTRHLKGNAFATNAIVEHLLIPLFGRIEQPAPDAPESLDSESSPAP